MMVASQSKGPCQTCRTRRIKCDENRPICLRCAKAQRPCVAADAAKQELFAIHLENHYASGTKKRPRGPRSSLIPLRPDFDVATRARTYYLQNHFQVFLDVPDLAVTWTECYHEWAASGKTSQMVDLAFSCLALSVFSQSQEHPPAAVEASKSYVKLLREMRQRIPSVTNGNLTADMIDEFLLTTYFMARYESFVLQNVESASSLETMKVWSHLDGGGAILRLWHNNRWRYKPTMIVRVARRTLIKSSLLRNQKLPSWLADGSESGESGMALEFDSLTVQIIKLRQQYSELEQSTLKEEVDGSRAQHLYEQACGLERALQLWRNQLPAKWAYQTHTVEENLEYPQPELLSATIFSCAKYSYAAVWNEYFATSMLVVNVRLQILRLVYPETSCEYLSEFLEASGRLRNLAISLASFIPWCLDRVRVIKPSKTAPEDAPTRVKVSEEPFRPYLANPVVWPMALATSLEELDSFYRQWFRSSLTRISQSSSECLLAYVMSHYWTAA